MTADMMSAVWYTQSPLRSIGKYPFFRRVDAKRKMKKMMYISKHFDDNPDTFLWYRTLMVNKKNPKHCTIELRVSTIEKSPSVNLCHTTVTHMAHVAYAISVDMFCAVDEHKVCSFCFPRQ